jgi:NADPH:quinone reductase-like Zn-dependent oxidoreductase
LDWFGGPETLASHAVPLPEVGPDDVLIHVESAGVGVWDPFEREGGFARMFGTKPRFPYVLGTKGAGTVAAARAITAAGRSAWGASKDMECC